MHAIVRTGGYNPGMKLKNPYWAMLTSPLTNPDDRRRYTPRRVFWMAVFGSVGLGLAFFGGIDVAARRSWDILSTCLVLAYAVGSVWCGSLAMRIKREELRHQNPPR
jgi:hypothetical protein